MSKIAQFTRTGGFKAVMLGAVILLLLIPVGMIKSIIRERTMLAQSAEEEIMRAWGDEFLVLGPVLQIPMTERIESKTKNEQGEEKISVRWHDSFYRLTPEKLSAGAELRTEVKKRGIFSVPLYGGEIVLQGSFAADKIGAGLKPEQKLHPERAELVIALSVKADWSAPSFRGSYLPIEKTIDEKGFSANWQISRLSRNIPVSWTGADDIGFELAGARFGVDFFKVLDHYGLNTRAVKYALLFLIVPFLSLFLIEQILRRNDPVHPVQYLLAGIGNVVFYLLFHDYRGGDVFYPPS
jgi:inner membrane protein involved in colicin E2 resistance